MLHREFVTLSEFAFDLQNGAHEHIDAAREELRAAGLYSLSAPVLRKEFYMLHVGTEYVLLKDRGRGRIEEPVNNIHNAHTHTARRRHRATAEQKTFIDGCVRDGTKPSRIMRRLEDAGLSNRLELGYIQRYKPNHKATVLGQAGFIGTMQEYEDLLDT